jgi:REP element-mobilizing transposase RayT
MWNDTDTPLAFFITFRCYGTWLHGDKRGSVDRHNNAYGSPRIPRNDTWHRISENLTKHPPVRLDAARRGSVRNAIIETCEKRGWYLAAVNVRTNHAHSVVTATGISPDAVLTAFKANATRKMREDGCWPHAYSPWAEKGSKRKLWNERSVANAIDYTLHGQGDDLPDFDQ